MKKLLTAVILLIFTLSVDCSAQLSMTVKSGSDKWGYAGGYLGAVQQWNGSRFELETKVHFPAQGKPGYLPRESWFGFYVQDTSHGYRYCPGVFNRSWDMSPALLPLGATRHEHSGGWDPIQFENQSLPVSAGYAIFRLKYEPADNNSAPSSLTFTYSTDGINWVDCWKYSAPADFAPDRIGLTTDSYVSDNSFGPVTFDYFKITGNGPAVSDKFDGSIDRSRWQTMDESRGDIRFQIKLRADFQPDENGYVFIRNQPAHVELDLKTTLLSGKSVQLTGKLFDYDHHELYSTIRTVKLEKETGNTIFDLPAEYLNRNGIYRLVVDAAYNGQNLGKCQLQFAVVEPRPAAMDFDPESPYIYCHIYNHKAMRRMGIRWDRGGWFSWDCPRRTDGTYDFEKVLDKRFAGAQENKIMPIGPMCGPGIPNELPASIDSYVKEHIDWITQVKKRYGKAFQMIEIGNEPENWPVAPLEQEWILMARAQSEITRQVHSKMPGVRVMSTGTTHINLAFLGQLAAVGGQDAADVIGVHGYRSPSAPEFGHEEDIRAIKALFPNKPIWVNEQAEFAFPPDYHPAFDNPDINPIALDELTQGIYLPRLLLSQFAAGYSGVSWYGGPYELEGLVWNQTYLRPGVCSLAALTYLLPHPKFVRRLTPYNGEFWALQFISDGHFITAIWSLGPRIKVHLPADGIKQVRNVFGNIVKVDSDSGKLALTVGQAPYYIIGRLSMINDWKYVANDELPSNPLIFEEKKNTGPIDVRILPSVSSMNSSQICVKVSNISSKRINGIISLKFNDRICDKPWPECWKLVSTNGNDFSLDPGASKDVIYKIETDNPGIRFDSYHPESGFFARWWIMGYFFTARATLDSGEKIDCVPVHGLCLRGVPRLNGVKIDGELNEWSGVPVFQQMGKMVRNSALFNYWNGEADYKPVFKFAWCSDGMLFSAEVADDIQHQIYTGARTWEGDSIDVALDLNPDQPSVVDYNLFTLSLTSKGPQCYRRRATKSKPEKLLDSVKLAVKRTNPDYGQAAVTVYEALIPWSELTFEQIESGKRLGFAVQFNESDGWGRMGWEGWFIPMGGQIVDPRRFGDLTLVQ